MDPQTIFCLNLDCPARGQVGRGNIGIHSRKERRYICHQCHQTFSETKGTLFYRSRSDWNLITIVVTLLAHGCPLQAIVAAFNLDERTVHNWQARAGQHCERLHNHLVEQPRDLGHVQVDEVCVKQQGQIVWLAMAIQVATRLWLGATLSIHRDEALLTALLQKIRACALCRPLLVCVDGWRAYPSVLQKVFREAVPVRGMGRPRLRLWDGLVIAQVVKQYERGRVRGVVHRIAQGTATQVETLLTRTQSGGVINTAFIERLNATFRARLYGLVRRGRSLTKQISTLQPGVYLVGTVYNFCTFHASLSVPLLMGSRGRVHWVRRTPAMAAGITDHGWSVQELMLYRVPPPRWTPPKRRGRLSHETKQLIQQWCT
jgi:transposase-like protein/IS1 family transposase